LALRGALLLARSSLINHHRDGSTGSEEYRRMSSITKALNEALAALGELRERDHRER
jgi:hypothetical protein